MSNYGQQLLPGPIPYLQYSQWSKDLVTPQPELVRNTEMAYTEMVFGLAAGELPGLFGGAAPEASPLVEELAPITSGGEANTAQYAQLKLSYAAQEAFTTEGALSQSAINGSREIIEYARLGNPDIPSGFSKFSTDTFQSPSGPFQVHYYANPATGEIYYELDYKAVFNVSR